jgi:hypothetical protein
LCPVLEFLKRVDRTSVAKLASDTPTPVPVANLPTDPNVLAALQDAGGLVESAVSVGGRYSLDDIAAILAAPTSAACGMLYRIVSDVAWAGLFERRPNKDVPTPASMERSLAWLDMLADGKRIFPFIESEKAGVIERVEASVEDVECRNGAVVQARPFYGQRSDQTCRRW